MPLTCVCLSVCVCLHLSLQYGFRSGQKGQTLCRREVSGYDEASQLGEVTQARRDGGCRSDEASPKVTTANGCAGYKQVYR